MAAPLYSVGDVAYLRESAAVGFLESCKIGSAHNIGGQWIYSMHQGGQRDPSMPLFGERITHREDYVRYFAEAELVSERDALLLARDTIIQRLAAINGTIAKKYPEAI